MGLVDAYLERLEAEIANMSKDQKKELEEFPVDGWSMANLLLVLRPLGRVLFVTELVARRFSIELPVDLRPILIHLAIPGASFPS